MASRKRIIFNDLKVSYLQLNQQTRKTKMAGIGAFLEAINRLNNQKILIFLFCFKLFHQNILQPVFVQF